MVQIELPDDDIARLRAYADAHGMTVSEVLRKWLRENGYPVAGDEAPST